MLELITYAVSLAMSAVVGVLLYRLGTFDGKNQTSLKGIVEQKKGVFKKAKPMPSREDIIKQKEIANFYNYDGGEMPNPKEGV